MGQSTKLNKTLIDFIEAQPMFFVATAADGRVNMSPKGMNSLRVKGSNRIVWLNLSGSGNETAGHILDNPRMTLMFCALQGDALILRTYGTARVIAHYDPEFDELAADFPDYAGRRQIFDMTIDLVQTSCGSGVPYLTLDGQRGTTELEPYYADMGEEGVKDFWVRKNSETLDGRPTYVMPPSKD